MHAVLRRTLGGSDADRAMTLHAEATALAEDLGVNALPPPHPQLVTG